MGREIILNNKLNKEKMKEIIFGGYTTLSLWVLSIKWMKFPRNNYDGD